MKGSQSKTPNLDKLGLIQHEVYWQKLKPTKISQWFRAAQLLRSKCLSHLTAALFIQHLQPRNCIKIWKYENLLLISFHKIQQECVIMLGLFLDHFNEYHRKLQYTRNVEIKNRTQSTFRYCITWSAALNNVYQTYQFVLTEHLMFKNQKLLTTAKSTNKIFKDLISGQ